MVNLWTSQRLRCLCVLRQVFSLKKCFLSVQSQRRRCIIECCELKSISKFREFFWKVTKAFFLRSLVELETEWLACSKVVYLVFRHQDCCYYLVHFSLLVRLLVGFCLFYLWLFCGLFVYSFLSFLFFLNFQGLNSIAVNTDLLLEHLV